MVSAPVWDIKYRGVAQGIGHLVWDQEVVGSSPTSPSLRKQGKGFQAERLRQAEH